jgi:hypothetical protein
LSSSTLNITEQVRSPPLQTPIRITRAQFRALSPFHQAVAIVFLRRGTGEVELIEDDGKQPVGATGA